MKNCECQWKVREKWNWFANVLDDIDIAYFITNTLSQDKGYPC